MPLREFRSREVSELPEGKEQSFRFRGVLCGDVSTGEEKFETGPVDLDKCGTIPLTFTNRTTRQEQTEQGLSFRVSWENGVDVDKPLNILSKGLIMQLHGDLETGAYLKNTYFITAVGAPPKTRYSVRREPLPGA